MANHVTITVLDTPRARPRRGGDSENPTRVLEVEVLVEHKTARNADGLEAIRTTLEVSGEELEQYEAGTLTLEQIIGAHYEDLEVALEGVMAKAAEILAGTPAAAVLESLPTVVEAAAKRRVS
jgi:hypothetical protein